MPDLKAGADDQDVLVLAAKTGRSPQGIAMRANSLATGEEPDGERHDGRGRPFVRALVLGAPDALVHALLANADDVPPGWDSEPAFSPGDWRTLRAAVLAEPDVNRDEVGTPFESAWVEWGNSDGGLAPMWRVAEFALVIGTDDAGENVAWVWSGEQRYIAAELRAAPVRVLA